MLSVFYFIRAHLADYSVFLLVASALSFALFVTDKKLAAAHKFRISEKALILSALFGGAPGALLAMYTVRHKTRHPLFYLTVPPLALLQTALVICALTCG